MYILNEGFRRAMRRIAERKAVLAVSREQMYLDERMHFEEMGMDPGNALEDRLPFKIVLMNPDGAAPQPHAHICGKGGGGKEIGTFVLTDMPPRNVSELIPYVVGKHKGLVNVSDEWRQMIVDWASRKSRLDPFRTNWQHLQHQWFLNAYITLTKM